MYLEHTLYHDCSFISEYRVWHPIRTFFSLARANQKSVITTERKMLQWQCRGFEPIQPKVYRSKMKLSLDTDLGFLFSPQCFLPSIPFNQPAFPLALWSCSHCGWRSSYFSPNGMTSLCLPLAVFMEHNEDESCVLHFSL